MPKAKIRHLAIRADDPEKLAKFYQDTFDMEIVHRSPGGGVFMTDGYLNIALLNARGRGTGLNHFGFVVEDMKTVGDKLEAAGMSRPITRPNDPPYAETRSADPEGNAFDLSTHGYDRTEFQADRKTKKVKEKV
jgi:catechol 2,3-dioxygenase-like lactoylglutathione lyase family enzyme